jgi:hypothetical protein
MKNRKIVNKFRYPFRDTITVCLQFHKIVIIILVYLTPIDYNGLLCVKDQINLE